MDTNATRISNTVKEETSKSRLYFSQVVSRPIQKIFRFLQSFNIIEVFRFLPEYGLEFFRNKIDSFDRIYGVDTTTPVSTSELGVQSETARYAELYWPTNTKSFSKVISSLPRAPQDFCFIDVGSGKGRALLLASEFKFQRVIGIEFSKELSEISAKNVSIFEEKTGGNSRIEIRNEDAITYNFPKGPLLIYMFDPFRAEIMEQVISNILKSFEKEPREIFVAYVLPMHKALFIKNGFEVFKEQSRSLKFDYPWIIFRKSPGQKKTSHQIETQI